MKVLIFVPQSRIIPASLRSIHQLDTSGYETTLIFERAGDVSGNRWVNVTLKYQKARRIFLAGDYDAMLTIEDDIIVPADALPALDVLNCDIAYGLTVTRHANPEWSAGMAIGREDSYRAFKTQIEYDSVWGTVIDDVAGCGLFCTLIRRHVLEDLDFVVRGSRCCDFYLAQDAIERGYSQRCDTRIVCGHCLPDKPGKAYWPDSTGYKTGEVIAGW